MANFGKLRTVGLVITYHDNKLHECTDWELKEGAAELQRIASDLHTLLSERRAKQEREAMGPRRNE